MALLRSFRHPRTLSLAAGAVIVSGLTLVLPGATAAPRVPRVVDVPSRPAFVKPQASPERPALVGQVLGPSTVLRTENPGRLQILLADGRSFRLGGNAQLRIEPNLLDLVRGRIIAWIDPGSKGSTPLRVRTRVGTASIQGTTVFIEATAETVLFLSWEGKVEVRAADGSVYRLTSGQRLEATPQGWKGPHRMDAAEARQRRRNSELLNGFQAPMQTLPVIERELGLAP
ncbi:FecR family protein [Synechococcus sp. CS-1332]|uniref:FecR family protein n=1 Tax=Synechococcus sp. CS-1332 TaxID=2847972 RepID=UPI00223A8F20|nr:FecR family protein [Synechococcus sp. CS-1332]MCT0208752.1 FecR family protein [Synechococcus sp. CS-1332]